MTQKITNTSWGRAVPSSNLTVAEFGKIGMLTQGSHNAGISVKIVV